MPLIDADKVDIPPTLMPLEATHNEAIAYQRVTKNCDKQFSENLVREIRHTYFAMIAALDEMVGRVLQTVDDLGLRDNTYVIFSSDHGEMAGDQNQILKRSMYEASSHVPLIIRGPDVQKGVVVDTPVSLVDLYPTFMDMARICYDDYADNAAYPDALDGESLFPQLVEGTGRENAIGPCANTTAIAVPQARLCCARAIGNTSSTRVLTPNSSISKTIPTKRPISSMTNRISPANWIWC